MGCGASKGAEGVASPAPPLAARLEPEFTPDTKPRPADAPAGVLKERDSRDTVAKRVDAIVKNGVSDFEDDKPVKPMAGPDFVEVVQTVSLPPPPGTPPAAAKKPMFQSADTGNLADAPGTETAAGTSYYPVQVSLNVAGGGFASRQQQQQQSSLPLQTSLQPFDLQQMPSAPLAEPSPPPPLPSPLPPPSAPAAAQPVLRSSVSARQLQQEALPALQQQKSSGRGLPPLEGQPQPLTESGPGPSSGSVTSLVQPTAAAAAAAAPGSSADDPWSSLQSTYRIREPLPSMKESDAPRSGAGGSRDACREVIVLGDDDDDEFSRGGAGGAAASLNSTGVKRSSGFGSRPPVSLPPPQFGSAPKKGGWGSGAMAQAGELMLGEDDWLGQDRPPGQGSLRQQRPPPPQQQRVQDQAVLAYNSRARLLVEEEQRHAPVALKGPMPAPVKSKAADDVMCEDVEDVDTLLEDEMQRQGLSNKDLASKLAAYEAQFADDD